MYYGDLFHKRRKTEPKPILALRSCTMVLLLIFLVVYVVFLIKYTISDGPVLQYSIERGDQILIPDVEIITTIPFNLTCKFVRTIDNDLSDDCRKYLIQETLPGGGSRGMFRNNNNMTFVNSTTEPNAIKSVFIGILSNAPNATVQPFPFTVNYPSNNPNNPINGELISNNFYFLIAQQVAQVRFTRHVRRTISSQFEGIFGINPSYDEQPYILSTMQSIPATIPDDPPDIFSSVIVVKVRSFFTTVETEQRSRTVLGMFGLVGGAWGLAVALYAFLFGVDRIAPWGFVQYRCGFCGLSARVRDELEDALPVIPLVDGSSSHEESAALQDRIRALDLFLREYVVDVDCLERLKERNKPYR